nr:putative ribonuclease H-like domain-containing protein [Tanacetum cinerariifolium]
MMEQETEELKKHLQIILDDDDDDDVYTDATPLASKIPIIDYKIHNKRNIPYFKIIKADGNHMLFMSFTTMLKNFDREDLESLWKIVRERFKKTEPKNFLNEYLLNTLKIMFKKPNVEANVWKDQKGKYGLAKVKSWKLIDSCGIHCLHLLTTQMFLIVEKMYPLTHFTLEKMVNDVRIDVDNESEMSLELFREHVYLTDYEELDRGYVAFGGNPKGGKITGKRQLLKVYSLMVLQRSHDDGFKPLCDDGKKVDEDPSNENECNDQEKEDNVNSTNNVNIVSSTVNAVGTNEDNKLPFDPSMSALENVSIFNFSSDDEDDVAVADIYNLDTTIQVSPILTTRINKDHPLNQVIGDLQSAIQTRKMPKNLEGHGTQRGNPCIKRSKLDRGYTGRSFTIQVTRSLDFSGLTKLLKRAIGTKWVFRNKKDERGIMIRNKARLVTQGNIQEEGIDYDEVFVRVARIEAISLFLAYASFKDFVVYQMDVKSTFLFGTIEEEVYVYQPPGFKDLDFPDRVYKVEKALYGLHQEVKTASTPMQTHKPLLKDEDGKEVDVYMYRLISWQCKKQTVVANSTTEAEYVATSSCCGQVRWIQNQLLDYGKPKRKNTQLPQPSGSTDNVANEAIHKELGNSLVRAATTPSSLEAEQDSGVDPTCQEAMRDTTAQTRFESVSKLSNDSLLARGNTHQSDEDRPEFNELMALVRVESSNDEECLGEDASTQEKIDALDANENISLVSVHDDAEIFDVNDLGGEEVFFAEQEVVSIASTTVTTKELTLAQALEALKTSKPKVKGIVIQEQEEPSKSTTTLSNQQSHDKEMFDRAFKRVNTFEDFKPELVERKEKRAAEELIQESIKKQKVEDDKETAELKQLMEIILDKEEVVIDDIPLAFNKMLKSFDKKDLEDLYKLVKARYGSTRPVEDLDLLFWGDLKAMFEPHVEDKVWKLQQGYKVLNWKLYDSCGVDSLRRQSMQVYMLVEKTYLLTPPTLSMMLEKKLQIDYEKEGDVEPGVILGRSFMRLAKGIVDFSNEVPKFGEELPLLVFKMGKSNRNKKRSMENLSSFYQDIGPSLSAGDHLTQEKAAKEALAMRIGQKFASLEEVSPVIEKMAYHDKYKNILDEIWKDTAELDGKIVKEEEEPIKRIIGEVLKGKTIHEHSFFLSDCRVRLTKMR